MRLNPGASTLVRTMSAHGVHCVLVSGGFESFTGPVSEAAGFAGHQANRLIQADGRLTGEVAEPILDREAKLEALQLHRRPSRPRVPGMFWRSATAPTTWR